MKNKTKPNTNTELRYFFQNPYIINKNHGNKIGFDNKKFTLFG